MSEEQSILESVWNVVDIPNYADSTSSGVKHSMMDSVSAFDGLVFELLMVLSLPQAAKTTSNATAVAQLWVRKCI